MRGFIQFIRRKKWWIIVPGVIILLLVGFLVFYTKYAKGYLVISATPENYNLEVAGKKINNVKKEYKAWLKPGTYIVNIQKENYLEYQDMIIVNPLKITRKEIILSQMYFLSATDFSDVNGGNFFTYSADGKNIIYFSDADKSFYKVSFDQKTYLLANNRAEKIPTNLSLREGDSITNIRYAPDKSKALIFTADQSQNYAIKLFDFNANQTVDLAAKVIDADWLSNSEIVCPSNGDGTKNLLTLNTNLALINSSPLSADASMIYASAQDKTVLIANDQADSYTILDTTNQKQTTKKIDSAFIIDAKPNPANGSFLVLAMKSDEYKTYLAQQDKDPQELDIKPINNLIVWTDDGKNLIYVSFEQDKQKYNFQKYTLADKKSTNINSYTLDIIPDSPSNLLTRQNYINFLAAQKIAGFKYED